MPSPQFMAMSRSRSLSPRQRRRRGSPGEGDGQSSTSPNRNRLTLLNRRHQQAKEDSSNGESYSSFFLDAFVSPRIGYRTAHHWQSSNSTSTSSNLLSQIPILTYLLIQVEAALPNYCATLAHPSRANAKEACHKLDLAIISNEGMNTTTSRENLQATWDSIQSPLVLFAASQVIYDGAHPTSSSNPSKLMALYVKIGQDLLILRGTLCEPFLLPSPGDGINNDEPITPNQKGHHSAAMSLSNMLQLIIKFTAWRCQLLGLLLLQERWADDLLKAGDFLNSLYQEVEDYLADATANTNGALPLLNSLRQEVQTWIYLTEASWNLEQCRFMDTILSVRKLKVVLSNQKKNSPSNAPTKLYARFNMVLQEIQNAMPLYFDRYRSEAGLQYGFDLGRLGGGPDLAEYDSLVVDFLKKQEGGPPMAICIVRDNSAVTTPTTAPDVPPSPTAESMHPTSQPTQQQNQPQQHQWPAMYMRSTLVSSDSSRPGSISSRFTLGGRSSASSGKHTRIMSNSKEELLSSPTSSHRLAAQRSATTAVSSGGSMELNYSLVDSWPHTEWQKLVTIIRNECNPDEIGPAMSFRAKEGDSAPFSPRTPSSHKAVVPSVYHILALSPCLWMVAVVKEKDPFKEGSWMRTIRRGHSEETIRNFLDGMSTKLRVSSILEGFTATVDTARAPGGRTTTSPTPVAHRSRQVLSVESLCDDWSFNNTQDWLNRLKQEFNLRPQSPLATPLSSSPYAAAFQSTDRVATSQDADSQTKQLRRRRGPLKKVSAEESAAALFLGGDILEMVKDGKLATDDGNLMSIIAMT